MSKKLVFIIVTIILMLISGCSNESGTISESSSLKLPDFSSVQKKIDVDKLAKKDVIWLKGSFVYEAHRGEFSSSLKETWKDTKEQKYYYGNIKKGLPDGNGILYGISNSSPNPTYLIIGNFSNGKLNGFCMVYDIFSRSSNADDEVFLYKIFEGYFKEGKINGNGVKYGYDTTLAREHQWNLWNKNDEKLDDNLKQEFCINKESLLWGHKFYDLTPLLFDEANSFIETGVYENGKLNGSGKEYRYADELVYDGDFKDGVYNGDGSLYGVVVNKNDSSDRVSYLLYKGEFKDRKYHGKGTLYNPDGSVKRKGKWKNGDVAN